MVMSTSPLEAAQVERIRRVEGVQEADNPLWTLANVVRHPTQPALSTRENERIVSLFCDNLGRLAKGRHLVGTLNLVEFY